MNTPLAIPQAVSMSSREIAELTGKRHADVLRDIRVMMTQVFDLQDNADLRYEEIQGVTAEQDSHTNRLSCIHLNKDYTITLLTGYDAKSRFKVIQRWQELESAIPELPDFNNPAAAARAWADEYEARRALELQLEADKPYTTIARAITGQNTMTRRDWCALMKDDNGVNIKERSLNNWLKEQGYFYRDALSGETRAYAQYANLFKLEVEMINGFPRNILKVTGDGVLQLTPKVVAAFINDEKIDSDQPE